MTDGPLLEHPRTPSRSEQDVAGVRAAAVDAAIRAFRRHAVHDVTLERVAEDAGLGLATLTEQFPTFHALVVDTIAVWNGLRMKPLLPVVQQSGAVAFLRAIVVANVGDPALMRMMTSMVGVAGDPGHPLALTLQQQWFQFHALVQRALARDIAEGREPATMEPARGAEQLIAMYEGMQLQSMLRPHMDVLEAYDRAITRLRAGWSTTYSAPVWDI